MGTEPELRGGSWNNNPRNVRVSNRNRNEPENRNNNIGFRCAGDAGPGRKARMAGAVRIPVRPGVPCPLPGFDPGEPPRSFEPEECQTSTVRSALW